MNHALITNHENLMIDIQKIEINNSDKVLILIKDNSFARRQE